MIEIGGYKYKTAIIHDWFCNMGGGDKVAEAFLDVVGESPIYTCCYLEKSLTSRLKKADIRTSFLQKRLKQKKDNHQSFLPLMPIAFESFNLNSFDIVISSSSCCAKGVITNPNTIHICYCHTPMRYAWEYFYEYTEHMGNIKKFMVGILMNYMRIWDVISANRVDYFVANSKNVANRIRKHYRREALVIYPPVNINYFVPGKEDGDFYLCVSRLVKYKRIDLAIKACNKLKRPLVVIGQGAEAGYLKGIAGATVTVLERQSDEVILQYYQKCKAFIFPGEEDFGMTPVEAQACGRPVIAYARGGALETVIDGETGVLFEHQTEESLIKSIQRFESLKFSKERCIQNAGQFSEDLFIEKMRDFIINVVEDRKKAK